MWVKNIEKNVIYSVESIEIIGDIIPLGNIYTIKGSSGNKYIEIYKNNKEFDLIGTKLYSEIYQECDTFIKNQNKYKDIGLIYKRNILIEGESGSGKTCIIDLLSNSLIDDILIFMIDNVNLFDTIDYIRDKITNQKVLIIIDGLDKLITSENQKEVLEFYKTDCNHNNIITITTISNLSYIDEKFNSMEVFNSRYVISEMNKNDRFDYFSHLIDDNIEEYVESSNSYNMSQCRELYILNKILNMSLKDSKTKIDNHNKYSNRYTTKKIGF